MKETDLRSKTCVVPVAIAAGLGMAGMGLVSSGVVVADTTSVTDTINVTVDETCTFKNTSDATFAGSALNGNEVEYFNDSGVHTFYLFCNNDSGYTVSATPHDLEATNTEDVISYTNNYTHTGTSGMWTAEIATNESGVTVTSPVPIGGDVIISSSTHSSALTSFTATYKAYVGTETSAGTYTGTIVYTLAASGASNGGASNSGSGGTGQNSGNGENGGASGDNSGGEVTNNNGGGSGDTGSGTNNDNSGSGDAGLNSTPNGVQSISPSVLNNAYNTTNTYNTTNYSGSGASTPTVASTQGITGGDSNGVVSSNNTGTSDSYEKPLGVTTSATKSSNEDSGVDPMPIIAAGAALAVAGVAVVALAKNKNEE